MVKRVPIPRTQGQSATEFLILLAIFTAISLVFYSAFLGSGQKGAIGTMDEKATDRIRADKN